MSEGHLSPELRDALVADLIVLNEQLKYIQGQIKAREDVLNYTGPAIVPVEQPKADDSDKQISVR